MESIQISDGVSLSHIRTDKFKTTSIAFLIRRQLQKSEATKNALIPKVLKRGTENYPDIQSIYKKAEYMYGAVFDADIMKKGEEQIIQFYLEIVNEQGNKLLDEAFRFLHDIVMKPLTKGGGFVEEYINGEKDNLKIAIEGRQNDKKNYAKLRCIEAMCKTEPFGIYGDGYINDLDEITAVNLYEHYQEIIKTSPLDFVVIGNCETDYLVQKVKELFIMQRGTVNQIPNSEYEKKINAPKEMEERMEIQQSKLCIGLRANISPVGDDYYGLLIANEIFGGGAESKLFLNVREKASLCYYVHSLVFRFKSIILIQSGIDEKDYDKAVSLIKEQLESVKKGDISKTEIDKAKKSIIKRFQSTLDNPTAIMDYYLAQKMLGDQDNIEDVMNKIDKIEKRDIVDAFGNVVLDTVYILTPEK